METKGRALYLFCLARSTLVADFQATGVGGDERVFLLRTSPDLCAVVSEVSIEDFCGPQADLQMQELAWIAPRACRHEQVVEEVMRHSPVFPAHFGTLFSSIEKLERFLNTHRNVISQFLDRISGQEEWTAKGLLDRKRALDALSSGSFAAEEKRLAASSPGTRYLRERTTRSKMGKELIPWLKPICAEVVEDLRKRATDFCQRQVLIGEPAGRGIQVVLNWAFLLPKTERAAFQKRIDRANAEYGPKGLVFEISGPWPPYGFVPSLSMETGP